MYYWKEVSRLALSVVILSFLVAWTVAAQPRPRPELPRGAITQPVMDQPVQIKIYKIKVDTENQVAQVVLEITFFNPNTVVMEETYIVPVPKGIALSDLTLCYEGKCAEGKLMDSNEARGKYEEIVRQTKDPALLEYIGDRAFQVRVFPIPPNGEQTVQIRFQAILERAGNLIQFLYRLTAQKQIEQLSIQVHLREDEPIANIYSPSHKVSVQKLSDREATASFEATQVRSAQDFLLFYTVAEKELGIDLLPYRVATQDGYFILLLSPALVEDEKTLPKDVVFVFDTSGSMSGEKIEQARASLKHAIGRLRPSDRFTIVAFSDTVREFRSQLVSLNEIDRAELDQFINSLDAAGGTNINDALLRGLDFFTKDDRLKTLVFLTDGLPSSGEEDPSKIVQNAVAKNREIGARLFVFGVGYDVNTNLLDELSLKGRGFSTYVEPGESIEREIAQFYDKVGVPLLTDLKLDFGALATSMYDLFPAKLPDLYKGSQLQIVGRYTKAGQAKAVLTGKRGNQDVRFEIDLSLPETNTTYNFLPRLWASRKVGHLLEQIRLKGETPELVQSVKTLAQKFGIVTPYTSYFAAPQDVIQNVPTSSQRAHISGQMTQLQSAPPSSSGQWSVQYSQGIQFMKEGYSNTDAALTIYDDEMDAVFQNDSGIWKPVGYTNQPTVKVKFSSDAYFWLVQHSNTKGAFKLGERVIVPAQGKYVEVTAADSQDGYEKTSDLTQAFAKVGIDPASLGSGSPSQTNTDVGGASGQQPAKEDPMLDTNANENLMLTVGVVALMAVAGIVFWMMRR
jgi:Ca-activated chloride channel family protein